MAKAKILITDDDENLSFIISTYLEGEGHSVFSAASGAQALQILQDENCDIILLDLVLPDTDGFSLISKFKNLSSAPIIVVSGKENTTDKVVGLELGADDYITKPFEMRELAARIKATLRRNLREEPAKPAHTETAAKDRIHFEDWVLDRSQYQVFEKDGTSLDLTSGEFKLLEALITAPNRVLNREQLFDLTREATFDGYDRAVDIQIGRIRKKFNDDPTAPRLIKTVRGIGYMFCGKIGKAA